jgi:hypothetical protein
VRLDVVGDFGHGGDVVVGIDEGFEVCMYSCVLDN